jgi:demethylmenaquinone methyltransferase/2-methoxy-6-polyprenyl-1,4-benzoquinol methylase
MNSPFVLSYERSLLLSQPLRESIIKSIVQSMQLPVSGSGLDIGCGLGDTTFALAEALGSEGRVVGLDAEEEFLQRARCLLQNKFAIKERIAFVQGDAKELPFADKSFDWAFSMDCVGAIPVDQLILLKEVSRVVKHGGRVCLAIWSSQILLPGYPLLEAQLNATSAGIAPFAAGMTPERHIMRALAWFRQAGFTDIRAQTLLSDVCPPLSNEKIAALTDLFTMRWGNCEKEVAPEIWQNYQRLCNPNSDDFILHNPDYYAFFTYSLFSGRVM